VSAYLFAIGLQHKPKLVWQARGRVSVVVNLEAGGVQQEQERHCSCPRCMQGDVIFGREWSDFAKALRLVLATISSTVRMFATYSHRGVSQHANNGHRHLASHHSVGLLGTGMDDCTADRSIAQPPPVRVKHKAVLLHHFDMSAREIGGAGRHKVLYAQHEITRDDTIRT